MTGIALVGTGMWGPRLAEAAGRAGLELGRCIRGEAEPETGAEEGIAARAAVLQALGKHAEAVA
jgi:3-hydroxyisobutyrate dehydrogenase-like beta-hydroxyacid dehydrogenase